MLELFYIGFGLLALDIIAGVVWGVIETVKPIPQLQPVIETSGLPPKVIAALCLLLQCCGLGVCGVAILGVFAMFAMLSGLPIFFWLGWGSLLVSATLVWGGEAFLSIRHNDRKDAYALMVGLAICWIGLVLQLIGHEAFFMACNAQLATGSPIFNLIAR